MFPCDYTNPRLYCFFSFFFKNEFFFIPKQFFDSLAGDIDRGGVEILRPGPAMLEEKTGLLVPGVVSRLRVDMDDEDSLEPSLEQTAPHKPLNRQKPPPLIAR